MALAQVGGTFPQTVSFLAAAPGANTFNKVPIPDAADGSLVWNGPLAGLEVLLQFTVEPDADGDGYGDETQDACIGTPGTLVGCPPSSVITGTKKADLIEGTAGDDVIMGLGGNDTILGKGGNDTLIGGSGKDRLFGDGGNDSMKGGKGKDYCDGGDGTDTAKCEKKSNIP